MRRWPEFRQALLLGIPGFLAAASPSYANPITYTETAMASGNLNGMSFTNATVTLTMTADTNNVTGATPSFANIGTSLTLDVTGFAETTFKDQTQAAVNQSASSISPNAGFGDNAVSPTGILFTNSNSFMSYDLTTDIGPIVGTAVFNLGTLFPTTTEGFFSLRTVSGNVTFTATISPVPAPAVPPAASLALLVLGFAGLGLIEYRRKPDQR